MVLGRVWDSGLANVFQSRSLGRAASRADNRISELQALIEELQWDTEKIRRRENRLNAHLGEILERVSVLVSIFRSIFTQYLQQKAIILIITTTNTTTPNNKTLLLL